MRIVCHLSSFYDWEPLPHGVSPTDADIKANRVKPSMGGQWLMRVRKDMPTHTLCLVPENQLIAECLDGINQQGRAVYTRTEAAAHHLSKRVMWHHAHRAWMQKFEVDDEGPNEELFTAMVAPHVTSGNVTQEEADEMLIAYLTKPAPGHHEKHLHRHFGIKEEALT